MSLVKWLEVAVGHLAGDDQHWLISCLTQMVVLSIRHCSLIDVKNVKQPYLPYLSMAKLRFPL